MNAAIESAFLKAIERAVNWPDAVFLTGTSDELTAAEDTACIAAVESTENVSGPLWKATIKIRLEAPFTVGREQFESRARELRAWVENRDAVNAVVAQGVRMAGYKIKTATTGVDSVKWTEEIDILAGVDTRQSP